jgi:hypothetical protein
LISSGSESFKYTMLANEYESTYYPKC